MRTAVRAGEQTPTVKLVCAAVAAHAIGIGARRPAGIAGACAAAASVVWAALLLAAG